MQKCCRSAGKGGLSLAGHEWAKCLSSCETPTERQTEGGTESKNNNSNNNDNNRLAKRGDDSGLLVRVFRLFPSPSPSPSTSLLCSVSRLVSRSALNASRRPTNNFLLAFWTDVLASNAAVVAPAVVPITLCLPLCSALALLLPATDFSQPLYEPCLQMCVCVCMSVSEVKHLRLLEAQNPGCLSDNDDDDDKDEQSSSSRRQEEK